MPRYKVRGYKLVTCETQVEAESAEEAISEARGYHNNAFDMFYDEPFEEDMEAVEVKDED